MSEVNPELRVPASANYAGNEKEIVPQLESRSTAAPLAPNEAVSTNTHKLPPGAIVTGNVGL